MFHTSIYRIKGILHTSTLMGRSLPDRVQTCVTDIAHMVVENDWSSCRKSAPFDYSSHSFPSQAIGGTHARNRVLSQLTGDRPGVTDP